MIFGVLGCVPRAAVTNLAGYACARLPRCSAPAPAQHGSHAARTLAAPLGTQLSTAAGIVLGSGAYGRTSTDPAALKSPSKASTSRSPSRRITAGRGMVPPGRSCSGRPSPPSPRKTSPAGSPTTATSQEIMVHENRRSERWRRRHRQHRQHPWLNRQHDRRRDGRDRRRGGRDRQRGVSIRQHRQREPPCYSLVPTMPTVPTVVPPACRGTPVCIRYRVFSANVTIRAPSKFIRIPPAP